MTGPFPTFVRGCRDHFPLVAGITVARHVYNTHQDRDSCVNSTVSAYAYSLDAVHWVTSPIQPYTTQVWDGAVTV